ncbi:MAG: glycosyltransferase family 4 protein [Dethiobacteria bacterium]|jgi:UDP-GlcNAc:undecaprenyl-phosphate GlcNAc-1-phosphate transferase
MQFLAVAVAFFLALGLTPLMRRLALRTGILDYPDQRKDHGQAMPLLGGAAVYLAFWLTAGVIIFYWHGGERFWGLFLGGSLILALGLWDDMRGLSYRVKFAGQFAAALLLLAFNVKIEFITFPFQEMVFLGVFVVPLTLIWVVGITNAVNLIDGVDGLATGVSAIAAIVMFAYTWGEFPLLSLLCLVLAGAALGFLPLNFPPARIYLGDTGSLFLGFMLAGFSIMGATKQIALTTLIIPILILGLPITDTFYVMWRRFKNGRSIFQADRGHIHHMLLRLGLTPRQTTIVLYLISLYFGGAAIFFHQFNSPTAWYFIPVIFLIVLLGLRRLDTLTAFQRALEGFTLFSNRQQHRKKG